MEQNKNNKFSLQLIEAHPWRDNSNPIWLATTLKFYRNVSKYLFPGKLDPKRQNQLLGVMAKAICAVKDLHDTVFLHGDEVSSLEKQFLFEHFLSLQSFQEASHKTEGFVVDDSGQFLAIFNVKNHLQMQVTECGQDLESGFSKLLQIETELGKNFEWAFNPRFGFLTADPSYAGTGLIVNLFLHLPALLATGKLPELIEEVEAIEASSMQGTDLGNCVGDMVVVRNRFTIGLSEEEIIRMLRGAANKLIGEEKNARNRLQSDDEMKNRVSRAYGMLLHSYQFETVEALSCLSLCKLALDIGWLKGIDHQALNSLFFDSRRAHLISSQEIGTPEEVAKRRAKLVHDAFANCSLLI